VSHSKRYAVFLSVVILAQDRDPFTPCGYAGRAFNDFSVSILCVHRFTMFSVIANGGAAQCAHNGCPATVSACLGTVGDNSAVTYCLRAQGWSKASGSSNVYCSAHKTHDKAYGHGRNNAMCLFRHNRDTQPTVNPPWGAAAVPTAPPVAPPPPPPVFLEQCCDMHCSAAFRVCRVCSTRMLAWTPDANALTPLACHTSRLVDTLNCLPAYCFPADFIRDITDGTLRQLGRHAPEHGRGDDREADAGNRAGSALMLAALFPTVYGIATAGPLRIFGTPPPICLTFIASAQARSGTGPDSRRQNAWEALLNHWQTELTMIHVRDLLAQTLCEMEVAIEMVVDRGNTKLVWELPRPALLCAVPLPVGEHVRGLFGRMV